MNTAALSLVLQIGPPPILWGEPGIGKSSVMEALARLGLKVFCKVIYPSNMLPEDVRGLPYIDNGRTKYAPPAWALEVAEKAPSLLFIDEMASAPQAVQFALMAVMLNGRVGDDLVFPANVYRAAAANPPDDVGAGYELVPMLANRLWHTDWTVSVDEWCQGEIEGWPAPAALTLPADWTKYLSAVRGQVTGYIRSSPVDLHQRPKDPLQGGHAWPSHRMWSNVIKLLAAARSVNASMSAPAKLELDTSLISGCVGKGIAAKYVQWREKLDLPDPEELLRDPRKAKLPSELHVLMVVLGTLNAVILENNTRDRWFAGWILLKRVLNEFKDAPDVPTRMAWSLANHKPADVNMNDLPDEVLAFEKVFRKAGLWGERDAGGKA